LDASSEVRSEYNGEYVGSLRKVKSTIKSIVVKTADPPINTFCCRES
jgi:hypothetical protein